MDVHIFQRGSNHQPVLCWSSQTKTRGIEAPGLENWFAFSNWFGDLPGTPWNPRKNRWQTEERKLAHQTYQVWRIATPQQKAGRENPFQKSGKYCGSIFLGVSKQVFDHFVSLGVFFRCFFEGFMARGTLRRRQTLDAMRIP